MIHFDEILGCCDAAGVRNTRKISIRPPWISHILAYTPRSHCVRDRNEFWTEGGEDGCFVKMNVWISPRPHDC